MTRLITPLTYKYYSTRHTSVRKKAQEKGKGQKGAAAAARIRVRVSIWGNGFGQFYLK